MTGLNSTPFISTYRGVLPRKHRAAAVQAMLRPMISVVTVVRNGERQIARTISSVAEQTYGNVQYVVIDGNSSDSTVQRIKEHERHIDRWLSEPDDGIYHAMNKALGFCGGEYIYFLNCGDCLAHPYVLEEVAQRLQADRPDILFGNALSMQSGRETLVSVKVDTDYDLYRHTICHQATFSARYVFDSIGGFDTRYRISADREWLLRAMKRHGYVLSYVDMPICTFDGAGISSRQRVRLRMENMKINYRHFGSQFYPLLLRQLGDKITHTLLPG